MKKGRKEGIDSVASQFAPAISHLGLYILGLQAGRFWGPELWSLHSKRFLSTPESGFLIAPGVSVEDTDDIKASNPHMRYLIC